MTVMITGGSKCGKSSFAERIFDIIRGRKIYLATMKPYGEEAEKAIERHRILRAGKGFETIEKYTDISELTFDNMDSVLLECIGNLLANEMFRNEEIELCADKIADEIKQISTKVNNLVMVTNQVGSDGMDYQEGTELYIKEMGKLNQKIASIADTVVECVYGIPVILKGEKPC